MTKAVLGKGSDSDRQGSDLSNKGCVCVGGVYVNPFYLINSGYYFCVLFMLDGLQSYFNSCNSC